MRIVIACIGFAALLTFIFETPAHAEAETRAALVLGNASHREARMLTTPQSDATGVAEALRRSGFPAPTVILDANQVAMLQSLKSFAEQAKDVDVAVVYFSGRAFQIDGENFLLSTYAKASAQPDTIDGAVGLHVLTEAVGRARRAGIVLLDACQDNSIVVAPTAPVIGLSNSKQGLARIEPFGNTLVIFAARDGTVCAKREGERSPFAEALITRLPTPGVEISLLFRQVRDDVLKATGGQQQPLIYGAPAGEPFYLVESRPHVPGGDKRSDTNERQIQLAYWDAIKDSTDPNDFDDFLRKYPSGELSEVGRVRQKWSRFWGHWRLLHGSRCESEVEFESDAPPKKVRIGSEERKVINGGGGSLVFRYDGIGRIAKEVSGQLIVYRLLSECVYQR